MGQDLYYRHSGHYTVRGLAAGSLAGLAAGLVLGPLYAYAILYIPIAGYVSIFLGGAFGGFVGAAAARGARWGKVRNARLVAAVTLSAITASYYLCWAVWIGAFLRRSGMPASFIALLLQPRILWEIILDINKVGAWSISGSTPTGLLLWFFWSLDALVVMGLALLWANISQSDPFCEACQTWCQEKQGLLSLNACESAEMRRRMEAKDFGFLKSLGAAAPDAASRFRLDLHACPSCHTTNTLTVQLINVTLNDGKTSESTTSIIEKLLLSAGEAHSLNAAAAA